MPVETIDFDLKQTNRVGRLDTPLGAKSNRYRYALLDDKTISGLETNPTRGRDGYNESIFDDKNYEEAIEMRAEKDHDAIVRHAETRTVGETFETPVGSASHATKIKKGDMKLEVETGDRNADVDMNLKFTAKVMMTFEVGPSKIQLTPAGIIVSAPLIKLN